MLRGELLADEHAGGRAQAGAGGGRQAHVSVLLGTRASGLESRLSSPRVENLVPSPQPRPPKFPCCLLNCAIPPRPEAHLPVAMAHRQIDDSAGRNAVSVFGIYTSARVWDAGRASVQVVGR